MIYCINPDCDRRQNPDHLEFCQACQTPLLVDGKYCLLQPLCPLDSERATEIFEVEESGVRKVMKILTKSSPKRLELLAKEAEVLEELDHPGIPKLDLCGYFEVELKTGKLLPCLVMEKIPGQNLEQWLETHGKISEKMARHWLVQLLNLLNYIHEKGLFHRDIKPANLMIKPDGMLAIIDFGSVREIPQQTVFAFRSNRPPNITRIVSKGYTAPEQINGRATPQSDLFALGRTFVHLLTDTPPSEFPIDTQTDKLLWRKQSSRVSRGFAEMLDDLMAPSPKNRPKDSKTVLKYLDNLGLRQIERFVSSPRFKTVILWSMSSGAILTIGGLLLYKSAIAPLQARTASEAGRKALVAEQYTLARQYFERAIALDLQQSTFYHNLGLACSLQQDFVCAEKNYHRSLQLALTQNQSAPVYYNLGQMYEKRGELDRAIKAYEIAIESPSLEGISAKNNYARLKIWYKRDFESAINVSTEIIAELKTVDRETESRKEPILATTYQNLGWAYLQQGRHAAAQAALERAIMLDKSNSAASYCLMAKVLQDRGEKQKALKYWETCNNKDAKNLPEVMTWQGDAIYHLNLQ